MDAIQPYLDYFSKNPEWALLIIFLIAFGEALLIIGLFVPSTVALVGAGMLVGMGQLPFWPVFWATAIGCILGDQVSYWAGRLFGQRLKEMWPLRDYGALVERGEKFVSEHGGKSIAIGRFIPGIKAVVPGIVGMLGMNQLFFIFVNVTSGLFWAAMHVFPGILLGQGLAIAGELSDKLLIVLVVLLVILGLAGWLIRLAAASVAPRLNYLMHRISIWAMRRSSRPMHRFGRVFAPGNPRSAYMFYYVVLIAAALGAFGYLIIGLILRDTVSNLDRSVTTLLGEVRDGHGDDIMIPLSMLADLRVVVTMIVAIAAWLFWHKAWRASFLAIATCGATALAVMVVRWFANRPGPIEHPELGAAFQSSFPSFSIALTATALGILVAFAGHAMGRWSKAAVAAFFGMWLVLISFAKLYLGAHWLSDVLASLAVATIAVGVFALALEALPARRIRPLGLISIAGTAYLLAGAANIALFEKSQQAFWESSHVRLITTREKWVSDDWRSLPQRRVDLSGLPKDEFVAQWQGDLNQLKAHFSANGWTTYDKWRLTDGFQYLRSDASISELPPKPLLNEGLKAHLTAVRPSTEKPGERLVLRLYPSRMRIASMDGDKPVYLASVTRDSVSPTLHLYALPTTNPPSTDEIELVLLELTKLGTSRETARHKRKGRDLVIFAP